MKNVRINIGVGGFRLGKLERKYLLNTFNRNRLSVGKYTHDFERKFAKLHGCRFGVFCNSGTSALQVSLHVLKRKYNWPDQAQIIVPAMTFVASINTVLQNNLGPVFADIEPDYFSIDPDKAEAAITPRTVAIMPVHLFGQAADMNPLMDLAEKKGLVVLEDSCETIFASYHGKPVGSFGEMSCFSTNSAHHLVTGVGGFVLTNDENDFRTARSLINHGRDEAYLGMDDDDRVDRQELEKIIEKRFKFIHMGYSYRLTELEAALGLGQLGRWKSIINPRQKNAQYLTENLSSYSQYLQLPKIRPGSDHVFMVYPIVVKDPKVSIKDLVIFLELKGVETRYLLPTLSQPIYKKIFGEIEDKYPIAKKLSQQGFYIGCHQELTKKELDYIIDCFSAFFRC